jgi:DNA-binding CsgD family transcriptional regulator
MHDSASSPNRLPIADLTAKQIECLELVLQHRSSKQIAQTLGISPHTVDQRLDSARRKLGAATRQDAAMAYAASKAKPADPAVLPGSPFTPIPAPIPAPIPERLVYEPPALAIAHPSPLSGLEPAQDAASGQASLGAGAAATLSRPLAATLVDLFKGSDQGPAAQFIGPQGAYARLVAIFVLAGLLMALGLVSIAFAWGLTYLLRLP